MGSNFQVVSCRSPRDQDSHARIMPRKFFLKSAIVVCLLSLSAFAQAGAASPPPSTAAPAQVVPQDENARKAKALLDKMIQALGGQAWLNVRDMREQGRTGSIYHDQPTGTAEFWLFWRYP